jgi:hypothetical protein
MKNKNLLFIIACGGLVFALLIIVYTCGFFVSHPAPDTSHVTEQAPAEIPEKTIETADKSATPVPEKPVKPASTEQPAAKTTPPPAKKPGKPKLETAFDFLTDYEGHAYYLSKAGATWEKASSICTQYGGHLVTITSGAENNALLAVIKDRKIRRSLFIGLADAGHEGKWTWITGEKVNFTYWDTLQPDNWKGSDFRGENYAQIWYHHNMKLPYHWNDASKNTSELFILEIEPK